MKSQWGIAFLNSHYVIFSYFCYFLNIISPHCGNQPILQRGLAYILYSDLLPIRHFWWFRTFKRASLRNPWNCNLAEVHYQINVSYILWNFLWNIRIRKRSGNENHLSIPLLICTYLIFENSSSKKQVRQTGFLACKIQFRNWFLQATQAVKIQFEID